MSEEEEEILVGKKEYRGEEEKEGEKEKEVWKFFGFRVRSNGGRKLVREERSCKLKS